MYVLNVLSIIDRRNRLETTVAKRRFRKNDRVRVAYSLGWVGTVLGQFDEIGNLLVTFDQEPSARIPLHHMDLVPA